MKNMTLIMMCIALTVNFAACNNTKNINGKEIQCYGFVNEDTDRDPNYRYAVDGWNILGAIAFFPAGSVLIPAVNIMCPISEK